MGIEMSAKGIGKAVLVFLGLSVVSALAVTLLATGVDYAKPGLGATIKSWFPFK